MSYFNTNLQQGSFVNRALYKDEIKDIKTFALRWKNLISVYFVKNVQRKCQDNSKQNIQG